MGIRQQIDDDIKTAMRARDEARLSTLRMVKAELLKAEKEKGEALTEERAMAALQTLLKQRRDSVEQFEAAGRTELAARERTEAEIIQSYLPEPLGEAEIDAAINEVLPPGAPVDKTRTGQYMGQVMGKLKASGRPFDGKAVNEQVRRRLEQA